jgi:hypothetical protein
MKRSPMPPRKSRIPRVNRQRKSKEWLRAYGSVERVEWVKGLSCVGCGRRPSENAHTVSGGKSRKADANTIAPLCGDIPGSSAFGCHMLYDRHLYPLHTEKARDRIKAAAVETESRWQSHVAGDAA